MGLAGQSAVNGRPLFVKSPRGSVQGAAGWEPESSGSSTHFPHSSHLHWLHTMTLQAPDGTQ
jgi:hypothetical protein